MTPAEIGDPVLVLLDFEPIVLFAVVGWLPLPAALTRSSTHTLIAVRPELTHSELRDAIVPLVTIDEQQVIRRAMGEPPYPHPLPPADDSLAVSVIPACLRARTCAWPLVGVTS